MEFLQGILRIESFLAVTLGIVVLFVGKRLNERIRLLRELSIPEPVTGGLLFSMVFGLVYAASGVAVEFKLRARDLLLVYFTTTIGINASFRDLLAGGRAAAADPAGHHHRLHVRAEPGRHLGGLAVRPACCRGSGRVQRVVDGRAWHHHRVGAGHPRAIRHRQCYGNRYRQATFGLILASLMGGPIAKFLINRHALTPPPEERTSMTHTCCMTSHCDLAAAGQLRRSGRER